ncbi:hypothetical protein H6P81_009830 [Aristolochia fimbriata]|uniref:Uncharacterized protein n=1 Tax=Aristolochia fimbriata TaxID=158543 RepID=A0AAV7EM11_ARIFI|nr:hypothetical protein H6P81_009830 [Aristolochia fimbriata]
MDWVAGSSQHSWMPVMTVDTTTSSYWLNWRVLLCSICVILSMIAASFLIWKYEGPRCNKHRRGEDQGETCCSLYEEESWKPCLKDIHPAWLLAYRVFAFIVMLILLIVNVIVDGGGIFYYYTQWTFSLVTVYFAVGSCLSTYGCYQFLNKVGGERAEEMRFDAERGSYVAPRQGDNAVSLNARKDLHQQERQSICHAAGIWGYIFQIIYQTSAGAVMLTDVVFWLIIFPFLTIRDYNLTFLLVGMHSVNAIFLLGDASLNCLRFPWFRFSYFILWTAMYVVFQWVIHACVSLWWPYPFLDLASPHAPIWYLSVGLLHVPCYAIFALFIKLKHYLLSKWFPHSHQCLK